MRVRRAQSWLVYLAIGAAASLVYMLLLRKAPLFNLLGLSSAVAILLAIRVNRPERPLPWYLFALGQALFVSGDVLAYNYERFFGSALPAPSIADPLYLSVYPVWIAGVLLIIRRRTTRADRTALIDSLIIAGGVAVLSWTFLMAPYAHDASLSLLQKVVAMAYPLMDLALLSVVARLAVGAGRPGPALTLIVFAVADLFVTDAIYGWIQLHGGYTPGGTLDIGWLTFYLLWGAAALHPSMRELARGERERTPIGGRGRLGVLAGASLLVPLVQVVQAQRREPIDAVFFAACAAALFVLVLIRMGGLMVDVATHSRTEIRLRELDDVKSKLTEALSHQLRTPLTVIMGLAKTLQRSDGRLDDAKRSELFAKIGANSERLSLLFDNLLDLDNLSRGLVEPNVEPTNVAVLVRRLLRERPMTGRSLDVQADEVSAMVDPAHIERILDILMSNALQYTPEGTPIWVRLRSEADGVLLTVEDAGPGVSSDMRMVVFESFRQGEQVVAHAPGVGVGLSIVAHIATLYGGRAWVADRRGGGASFNVLLCPSRSRQAELAT